MHPKLLKLKIAFLAAVALLLLFAVTPRGYAQTVAVDTPPTVQPTEPTTFPYKKTFIISAYYLALPGQSRYEMGSYEADIKMNGDTIAADGTRVYPGMAASDKRYPFGTKMEIPGFGIVTIHDRGGAIKNNRLDLWMGTGEEGLRRALRWGMRTVEVTVYGVDSNMQDSVNFTDIGLESLANLPSNPVYFDTDLGEGDDGDLVRELQFFLKKIGFFNSEATGYFGKETALAVKKFQLSEKVIADETDPGAGNFGPKTRFAFESYLSRKRAEMIKSLPSPPLYLGNSGDAVMRLQKVLDNYGYLDGINGKFNAKTQEALMRFQIDAGVIANRQERGAGYYGAKTAENLKLLIDNSLTPGKLMKNQPGETEGYSNLSLGDKGPEVVLLQDDLFRLNFMGIVPTGYYGKITEHAVFKFQQAFGIVQTEKDSGAGIVGPQTSAKLREISNLRIDQYKKVTSTGEKREIVVARVSEEKQLVAGYVPTEVFSSELAEGSRGADVEKLQKVLKRLGFFQGRLTTQYFGNITKNALLSFQRSHSLNESGTVDIFTRKVLNQILSEA